MGMVEGMGQFNHKGKKYTKEFSCKRRMKEKRKWKVEKEKSVVERP
jgi:hypothetical protein